MTNGKQLCKNKVIEEWCNGDYKGALRIAGMIKIPCL